MVTQTGLGGLPVHLIVAYFLFLRLYVNCFMDHCLMMVMMYLHVGLMCVCIYSIIFVQYFVLYSLTLNVLPIRN